MGQFCQCDPTEVQYHAFYIPLTCFFFFCNSFMWLCIIIIANQTIKKEEKVLRSGLCKWKSQQYFSCDRYLIFHELNDSFTTGCKIKNYSSPDDDSLINDGSFIAKTDLNFEKSVELKYPTSKLLLMNNNCTTRLIQKL